MTELRITLSVAGHDQSRAVSLLRRLLARSVFRNVRIESDAS